jgi:excinuclease UvrABC nuclease subunit
VLTEFLAFAPGRDAEMFSTVPASPAVFSLRSEDAQAEPYVSKTANLRRRLQRLLGPVEEGTKKLSLRHRVRSIAYTPTGSDFESRFVLYNVLRSTFPGSYSHRLRFRFAPLVKLHLENEYPRPSITTRLGRLKGRTLYYGPFASRTAAEKFMNDSLDFFKMRRCVDDLHPDPKFPGCIYSEMKMCLAPCFKGCSEQEYSAEVARVQAYFDSGGESLARELSVQRDRASSTLAFEEAAAIHVRLEKLKPIVSQFPEIIRRLDRFSALIIQPCHLPDSVNFFRVECGFIYGPQTFCIQTAEHTKSQSMESRVQTILDAFQPAKTPPVIETMEHLALLKRWYYRSRRMGEIFLADDKRVFPMRRIVRGIGRVFRGEGPELQSVSPSGVAGGNQDSSLRSG